MLNERWSIPRQKHYKGRHCIFNEAYQSADHDSSGKIQMIRAGITSELSVKPQTVYILPMLTPMWRRCGDGVKEKTKMSQRKEREREVVLLAYTKLCSMTDGLQSVDMSLPVFTGVGSQRHVCYQTASDFFALHPLSNGVLSSNSKSFTKQTVYFIYGWGEVLVTIGHVSELLSVIYRHDLTLAHSINLGIKLSQQLISRYFFSVFQPLFEKNSVCSVMYSLSRSRLFHAIVYQIPIYSSCIVNVSRTSSWSCSKYS